MHPLFHRFRFRRHSWSTFQTASDRVSNIVRLFLILIALGVGHVVAMSIFEDMSFADAVWLTMTTLTTVGYGDMSATSPSGRFFTVVLMYMAGIFLLAQIVGEFIEYRVDQKDRILKGMEKWNMKDHIVIINTPDQDGDRYLQILIEQIRLTPSLEDCPIQIFTSAFPDGLPAELRKLGVVHHHGRPEGGNSLSEVDAEVARFILILAVSVHDFRSDSVTLDILDQLNRLGTKGYVIAECIQDENRHRLKQLGANSVLRPVRAYPELMVRTMAAPGTEEILENLFQYEGVHPRRYDVEINKQRWSDLAIRFLQKNLGTPLGFLDDKGTIITNPHGDMEVFGSALFIMVSHDRIPAHDEVLNCITG